jgi:hypothetical protein
MNEITTAKAQFAAVLTGAGFRVSEYVPERTVPPVVIIASGSPYITPASIANEYIMNLTVSLVAATATNKQATEKLDDMVEAVLNVLPNYSRLSSVATPYILTVNNAEYLAADMVLDLRITI